MCRGGRELEEAQRAEFAANPGLAQKWVNVLKVEKKRRSTLDSPLDWVVLDHKGRTKKETTRLNKIWE